LLILVISERIEGLHQAGQVVLSQLDQRVNERCDLDNGLRIGRPGGRKVAKRRRSGRVEGIEREGRETFVLDASELTRFRNEGPGGLFFLTGHPSTAGNGCRPTSS
jgi:hypothetical protein